MKDYWYQLQSVSDMNVYFGFWCDRYSDDKAWGAHTISSVNESGGFGCVITANLNREASFVFMSDGRPAGHPSDGRSLK